MAESAIKAAVQLLGNLLVEQISHLGDVRGQVEGLKDELSSLAAYAVGDAAKTRCQDEVVRVALSDARNIAYDCEDVIEKYIHQVACHGYEEYEGCQMGSLMRWACLGVNAVPALKISTQIAELNIRISSLQRRMISYSVSNRISVAENNRELRHLRRVHTHNREEAVVVGFESQTEELAGRLLNPLDKTVIALCGMGGIGKSTMARELVHHNKLRDGGYFKAFGWAVASQPCQPDKVLRELLYSLVSENDYKRQRKIENAIQTNRAHGALYELMREIKCLVIIDDIWTSSELAELEAAFPRRDATGIRIILTTRNEEAVSHLDPDQVYLYPVKALDDSKSWELFQLTAFPGGTCTDPMKEKFGRAMLQHCKGVPLAIVVLSKVLRRKDNPEDWQRINDSILAEMRRGGIPNLYKQVYDVLKVSYDELPFHLKHCFLHLAFLPQGYRVPVSTLYQLWVAEGIVLKHDRTELEEDTAESYLNELVSRNMVQVDSWFEGTSVISHCGLHDLMRDVCIEIAKEEGFLHTIHFHSSMLLNSTDKNTNHILMNSLTERDKGLRRLAVYIDNQEANNSTLPPPKGNTSRAPNLRSLILFSNDQGGEEDGKRLMETIVEDCPLLRVFGCDNYQMKGIFPKKVSNLINLRYLSLKNTRITDLPSSIAKLQLLQTLDLRVHDDVVIVIPNVLWKMKALRHVFFPYDGGLRIGSEEIRNASVPQRYSIQGGGLLRLDGLVNLQTLMPVDLDGISLDDGSNLGKLKTFCTNCETNLKLLQRLLPLGRQSGTVAKIFALRVYGGIINEDPMVLSSCEALDTVSIYAQPNANFKLRQPLRLEMFPQRLANITLWYLQLDDDPLPVLEKLPHLHALGLVECYGGQKMVCTNRGFPRLRRMYFYRLPSFRIWEVEEGALPKLNNLSIYDCPLMEIPGALSTSVNVKQGVPTRFNKFNTLLMLERRLKMSSSLSEDQFVL